MKRDRVALDGPVAEEARHPLGLARHAPRPAVVRAVADVERERLLRRVRGEGAPQGRRANAPRRGLDRGRLRPERVLAHVDLRVLAVRRVRRERALVPLRAEGAGGALRRRRLAPVAARAGVRLPLLRGGVLPELAVESLRARVTERGLDIRRGSPRRVTAGVGGPVPVEAPVLLPLHRAGTGERVRALAERRQRDPLPALAAVVPVHLLHAVGVPLERGEARPEVRHRLHRAVLSPAARAAGVVAARRGEEGRGEKQRGEGG